MQQATRMQTLHGVKIRKFEPGACGLGSFAFLQDMGYGVCQVGKSFKVWPPGKKTPMRMREADLMKLIDDERVRRGLEPIVKRAR